MLRSTSNLQCCREYTEWTLVRRGRARVHGVSTDHVGRAACSSQGDLSRGLTLMTFNRSHLRCGHARCAPPRAGPRPRSARRTLSVSTTRRWSSTVLYAPSATLRRISTVEYAGRSSRARRAASRDLERPLRDLPRDFGGAPHDSDGALCRVLSRNSDDAQRDLGDTLRDLDISLCELDGALHHLSRSA